MTKTQLKKRFVSRRLSSSRGFSLLEATIATALGGVLILGAGKGLTTLSDIQKKSGESAQAKGELLTALSGILKAGRLATSCSRINIPSANYSAWLECRIDQGAQPTEATSDDVSYRFGIANGALEWQQQLPGGAFEVRMRYSTINSFVICDDATMSSRSQCGITPTTLATAHARNLAQSGAKVGRFFRLRLGAAGANGSEIAVQSAFTVRHPAASSMRYVWGLMDGGGSP